MITSMASYYPNAFGMYMVYTETCNEVSLGIGCTPDWESITMSCFIYYGHFYRLTIGGVEYRCRSTLEIVRSRNQAPVESAAQSSGEFLLNQQPDAVFVMLNPGSSHPRNGQESSNCISPCQIDDDAKSNLVLACPDPTQKAIEIVMSRKQFDHVRVLNLFDIRDPESKSLVRRIRISLGLEEKNRIPYPPNIQSYSIFSEERRCELRSRLNAGVRQMVIAAWTKKPSLDPFFRQFYQILEGEELRIHGLAARGFYHPSRMKNIWANYVVDNWPNNAQNED